MVEANNIHKSYGKLEVLKGVDVKIAAGEIVSIVGASGAGKSTLLHILGTLDRADSGTLHINQTAIQTMNEKKLAQFRNTTLGFVFQFHHLLPEFTALENIAIPAMLNNKSQKEAYARARELLNFLQLEQRENHKPNELSGGEQQRVAVARALVNQPKVVFADEPSGNLDSANAQALHQLFFKLREELGQTFVIVTHNEELATMADRCLQMKDGKII
ncbi:MAG: ABC transporter ATP-binding protein [Bacteroidetes bacterium]|nr:ABC transporter ATP-binding protein [Bacteroidota bacterium]MCB9042766.1 ABC transporter ATP-binding protein [Chitinophagales bacterium]